MNYKKIYDSIIEKRKLEEPEDYIEVHHIVPASLGGSNDKNNLIRLTAREHFICHYLLTKIYPEESLEWYKMNHAFMMMKCANIFQNRYFNSRLYEALRGNFSSIMSIITSGKGNSQYGTMWICNIELQENRKIKKDDVIPDGWIKGRNKWNIKRNSGIGRGNAIGERCLLDKKKEADILWKHFIDGNFKSINEFSKTEFCNISQPAIINLFKKYIPEYGMKSIQGKSFNFVKEKPTQSW